MVEGLNGTIRPNDESAAAQVAIFARLVHPNAQTTQLVDVVSGLNLALSLDSIFLTMSTV